MSRSVTVTDGVLTEEDVLRRSRAANLGSVKHLTIYGAGREHHNRRLHSRSHPPIASAHHRVPAVRGSARRIYRVPADALRDALARWKPGGRSTPHAHIVWDARRAAVGLVTRATCTCAQVVTLAPFASCAALIELFLRSNAICDLEEVTHTTPLGLATYHSRDSLARYAMLACVREAAILCRSRTCARSGCCTPSGCSTTLWRAGPTTALLCSAGCRSSR